MSRFETCKYTAARRLSEKIKNLFISTQYLFREETAMDQMNWPVESEWSDLHHFTYRRLEESCLKLIITSVVQNRRTAWGDTPLHLACSEANSRCIEGILQLQPNVNIQNQMQFTPLNVFMNRPPQNEDILIKLLDAGANSDIADADGFSPLHTLALQLENEKTRIFARLLIEHKANVNSVNNFHETPLHLAISEGNEGLVDILLESGASMYISDAFGRTPMDIALVKRSRYPSIFESLSKHMILQYYCGFRVNLRHLEEATTSDKTQIFRRRCEEEIQQLKSTRVGDSTVSYYDILVSSTHVVARYLFNINILISLHEFDGSKSIFGPILMKKFGEALKRFHGLQIGTVAITKIFPFLPDVCVGNLVQYLDTDDFNNLHGCFSSRSQILK